MRRRKMLNLPLAKLVLPVDQVPRNATMKTIKLSLKIQEEFIQKRPRKSSDHADTRQHLQPTFNSIIPPAQNTPTRKANFPSKETVLSKKQQPHTLPKCLKSRSIPEARSTNRRQLNVRSLETINSRILTPLWIQLSSTHNSSSRLKKPQMKGYNAIARAARPYWANCLCGRGRLPRHRTLSNKRKIINKARQTL